MNNISYNEIEDEHCIKNTIGKIFFKILKNSEIKCRIQYSEKTPNIHEILNKFCSENDCMNIRTIQIDVDSSNVFSADVLQKISMLNLPVELKKIIIRSSQDVHQISKINYELLLKHLKKIKMPLNTILKFVFYGNYELKIRDTDSEEIIRAKSINLMSLYIL